MTTFSTIGTFGDTIYSLSAINLMGSGELYVKLNAIDDFCRNTLHWASAGPHAGRYTQRDYEIIEPLLKAQKYLHLVKPWQGQAIDHPLENHYKCWIPRGWEGNQTECYAILCGFNINDPVIKQKVLHEPWLTPLEPIKIPGKSLVINRTDRYLPGKPTKEWENWLTLLDSAVFVGSESEHAYFEETFKKKIDFFKTNDLLELAKVIQGADLFIGNQSVALSIAIGLGIPFRCELRKDFFQTTRSHSGGYGEAWFPRSNGGYFLNE